jgi:hypothetical protein
MESISLSSDELAALDRLEDEQARGETIKWDRPKTIRGVVARDVETVASRDRDGNAKTSRVLTLRTQDGLKAIFDGVVRLNWFIFGDKPPSGAAVRPPRRGDLLIVDYRGEKTAPDTGRTFKDFSVTSSSPSTSSVDAETAALIGGDPGPALEPNDPGVDEPETVDDDIPF